MSIPRQLRQKYKDYLNSPEWKEKRWQVLQRDKYRCQLCSKNGDTVHHKTYDNLGAEPLEDLITLCKFCHNAYHRGETLLNRKKKKCRHNRKCKKFNKKKAKILANYLLNEDLSACDTII